MLTTLLGALLAAWFVHGNDAPSEDATDIAREAHARRAHHGAIGSESAPVQIAFSGTVRAQAGRAIAGAEVCASCASCDSTALPPAVCTRTGAAGEYALEARTARSVILSAAGEGYDVGYARNGLPIKAQSGAQSGLDIVLQPGGALLSGTVLDALGGPVPRARVVIERADGWTRWTRETRSDDDGHFELQTSRGFQVVRAEIEGYAPRSRSVVAPARDVAIQLTPESVVRGRVLERGTKEPVEGVEVSARMDGFLARSHGAVSDQEGQFTLSGLEPGRYLLSATGSAWRASRDVWVDVYLADVMKDVELEVAPAVHVIGRVRQRGKDGLEPCPRGVVTLEPPADSASPTAGNRGVAAQIEGDGVARFLGLAAGRYDVTVRCPGHVLADGPRKLEVADRALDVSWTVQPGLSLMVNVVDELGQPLPRTPILLVGELDDRPGVPIVPTLVSDERGRAVVGQELTPGKYSVHPSEGCEGQPASVQLRQGAAPAELTLKLAGGGSIDVLVRDQAGAPLGGLQVSAFAEAPATPATPVIASPSLALGGVPAIELGDGHYRLAPLKPASYAIKVEDGVNPSSPSAAAMRTQVRPGQTLGVQLTLPRGGVIRGKVVNEHGDPEDNVWVNASAEAEVPTPRARAQFFIDPPGRALTNADGEFELAGLTPGARYTLRVKQPFNNAAAMHGVSEGQTVRFVLPASGSIAGVLVDARGAPLPHTSVSAQHPETHIGRGAISGTDGTFSIDRIPAGRVQLSAGQPGIGFAQLELELAPGQHVTGQALSLAPAPQELPRAPGAPGG